MAGRRPRRGRLSAGDNREDHRRGRYRRRTGLRLGRGTALVHLVSEFPEPSFAFGLRRFPVAPHLIVGKVQLYGRRPAFSAWSHAALRRGHLSAAAGNRAASTKAHPGCKCQSSGTRRPNVPEDQSIPASTGTHRLARVRKIEAAGQVRGDAYSQVSQLVPRAVQGLRNARWRCAAGPRWRWVTADRTSAVASGSAGAGQGQATVTCSCGELAHAQGSDQRSGNLPIRLPGTTPHVPGLAPGYHRVFDGARAACFAMPCSSKVEASQVLRPSTRRDEYGPERRASSGSPGRMDWVVPPGRPGPASGPAVPAP